MKKLLALFVALPLFFAAHAAAALPGPLPSGWRMAEWWDLEGRDRQDLLADFNGDGNIDFATIAVREDAAVVGLLVWYAGQPGAGKWTIVEQQKRPPSPLNVRLETLLDDDRPKQTNILYCKLSTDCSVFTWYGQSGKFERSAPARKAAK